MDSGLVEVLVWAIALLPIGSTLAAAYLWRIYVGDPARPRSWLLLALAIVATLVNVVAYWFGGLALVRVVGDIRAPEWTIPFTVTALLILEAVPIILAVIIYLRRRGKLPPPKV